MVNRFFLKQESRGVVVFLSSNISMRAIRNRMACCASKGATGRDIVNVVAFLVSEESGNMTGEI